MILFWINMISLHLKTADDKKKKDSCDWMYLSQTFYVSDKNVTSCILLRIIQIFGHQIFGHHFLIFLYSFPFVCIFCVCFFRGANILVFLCSCGFIFKNTQDGSILFYFFQYLWMCCLVFLTLETKLISSNQNKNTSHDVIENKQRTI